MPTFKITATWTIEADEAPDVAVSQVIDDLLYWTDSDQVEMTAEVVEDEEDDQADADADNTATPVDNPIPVGQVTGGSSDDSTNGHPDN